MDVPNTHKKPRCPLYLEESTKIEVAHRDGAFGTGQLKDFCHENWIQDDGHSDIVKFRIIE